MRFPRWLALAFLSSTLLGLPGIARAEDEEAARLEAKGEAVRYSLKTTDPVSRVDTGGAAILVHAPIAAVRKVVTRYDSYAKLIKPFDQSRVLSRKGNVSEVYLKVPVAHGAANVWAVTQMTGPIPDGAGEKIVGQYTNKGNVDDFRATWRMRAIDAERTIVKLEILVEPRLPLPASMITPELKYAADKGVTAVKEAAEKSTANVAKAPPNQTVTKAPAAITAPSPPEKPAEPPARKSPTVAKR